MLLELQIYIDTGQVCRARRRGSAIALSRTIDANLDCAFVENAQVFVVPNIEFPRKLESNGGLITYPLTLVVWRPW